MPRARSILGSLALVAVGTTAGCHGASQPRAGEPPAGRPSATAPSSPTGPVAGCPTPPAANGAAAVDFVNFIHAFGRMYIAGLGSREETVNRDQLGRVLLRSRCSFSALNDRTHQSPGEPRDGDTAFLPRGTPIYAVKGWPADCRIAAEQGGQLRVFLAFRTDTKTATPRECALRQES